MTWQMEQWSLIIFVIWPIGFYLMLALLNHVDSKRTKITSHHNHYHPLIYQYAWERYKEIQKEISNMNNRGSIPIAEMKLMDERVKNLRKEMDQLETTMDTQG